MKKEQWNEALSSIDPQLVSDYISEKELLKTKKQARQRVLHLCALTACFCLIVSVIVAVPFLLQENDSTIPNEGAIGSVSSPTQSNQDSTQPSLNDGSKDQDANSSGVQSSGSMNTGGDSSSTPNSTVQGERDPYYTKNIIDATSNPQLQSGSNIEILLGASSSSHSSDDPPAFRFNISGAIVNVRVVESYEAIYQIPQSHPVAPPNEYRILKMEVVEVLRGKTIPTHFLYLLPSYLYVDMSVYDTLLINMVQMGTEGYVITNKTQNQLEVLSLPLFADYQLQPQLGNIIAFTNGIFDESLWQTPSWIYGYQFARSYLDNGGTNLVVSRGCTVEEAIERIYKSVNSYDIAPRESSLITLSFSSDEAKDAVEYAKPFENGVFFQSFDANQANVIFTRYVNGCQTDETIKINLSTEEVTYSKVKYTKSDLESIENLSYHIAEMASRYKDEIPTPPHLDAKDKELFFFSLYGWYVKVNGKVYGIIKTTWKYRDNQYYTYLDDSYTLYEPNIGAIIVSREVLADIIGESPYISYFEYGLGEPPVFE